MRESDFILIQVNPEDKYYELARVRPYFDEHNKGADWVDNLGWYCDGFGQNNGKFYEFSIHLGTREKDITHKFINLGYPVEKHDGERVLVK